MRRPAEIHKQERAMTTLVELTSVFEGIASMRIAQIKNQVLQASEFFHELWAIYSQLHVDSYFGFGRSQSDVQVADKELNIIITAEGGFSGDIDQKLIDLMLATHDPATHDIIVIGHHGAIQLAQQSVSYKKYFKLPLRDQINVAPIMREVQQYRSTTVYYQEYISLMVQEARKIELSTAVQQRGKRSKQAIADEISEATYIFEPSSYDVVDHLERSMMQIAISQLILESKLAQYASRFRAMSASHERADEALSDLHTTYNRAKRAQKDERLKEIVNGLKKSRVGAAV